MIESYKSQCSIQVNSIMETHKLISIMDKKYDRESYQYSLKFLNCELNLFQALETNDLVIWYTNIQQFTDIINDKSQTLFNDQCIVEIPNIISATQTLFENSNCNHTLICYILSFFARLLLIPNYVPNIEKLNEINFFNYLHDITRHGHAKSQAQVIRILDLILLKCPEFDMNIADSIINLDDVIGVLEDTNTNNQLYTYISNYIFQLIQREMPIDMILQILRYLLVILEIPNLEANSNALNSLLYIIKKNQAQPQIKENIEAYPDFGKSLSRFVNFGDNNNNNSLSDFDERTEMAVSIYGFMALYHYDSVFYPVDSLIRLTETKSESLLQLLMFCLSNIYAINSDLFNNDTLQGFIEFLDYQTLTGSFSCSLYACETYIFIAKILPNSSFKWLVNDNNLFLIIPKSLELFEGRKLEYKVSDLIDILDTAFSQATIENWIQDVYNMFLENNCSVLFELEIESEIVSTKIARFIQKYGFDQENN